MKRVMMIFINRRKLWPFDGYFNCFLLHNHSPFLPPTGIILLFSRRTCLRGKNVTTARGLVLFALTPVKVYDSSILKETLS